MTLTNSRLSNFYQSIRAGQNCIVNINKSAFMRNYGKAIVMINPIFLKVSETLFENNEENIHIKYMDECLYVSIGVGSFLLVVAVVLVIFIFVYNKRNKELVDQVNKISFVESGAKERGDDGNLLLDNND